MTDFVLETLEGTLRLGVFCTQSLTSNGFTRLLFYTGSWCLLCGFSFFEFCFAVRFFSVFDFG